MIGRRTLVLAKSQIAALAAVEDYFTAVADGFRAHGEGRVHAPPPMEISGEGGAFHIKGASMEIGGRRLSAAKFNGNFPSNLSRGLPTIQGALLLADAETGALLAIMDSIEITLRRTAAASAVAADLFASPEADTLLICGCGVQGRAHFEALGRLRRFRRGFAYDKDLTAARSLAADMSAALGFPVAPSASLDVAAECDLIATVTTARAPLPLPQPLRRGAFIAAAGADNSLKSEIAPSLMARSVIITDVSDQCARMGDLRAAIEAGAMTRGDVRAELGEALIGKKAGRRAVEEIIIFDSTGAAFQDLTAAAMIYDRATAAGIGAQIDLQR